METCVVGPGWYQSKLLVASIPLTLTVAFLKVWVLVPGVSKHVKNIKKCHPGGDFYRAIGYATSTQRLIHQQFCVHFLTFLPGIPVANGSLDSSGFVQSRGRFSFLLELVISGTSMLQISTETMVS